MPRLSHLFSKELFFESVKHNFAAYYENEFFIRYNEEAIFIYEHQSETLNYTGIIVGTDINDYQNGLVIKHENTLVPKVDKQLELLHKRKALIKPIVLAHPPHPQLDQLIEQYKEQYQASFSVNHKKEQHTFWRIENGTWLNRFQQLFEQVDKAYICDGHHRSATVEHLYHTTQKDLYRTLFSIYLPFDQVKVSNWNRVIFDFGGRSALSLLAALSQYFEIKSIVKPYQPHQPREMVMYLQKEWFQLKWRNAILEPYQEASHQQQLDISIFNKEIVNGLLNIQDVRSDKRIEHIESAKGFDGLAKLADSQSEEGIGFIFSALELEDMIKVTEAGDIMPPKSTYMLPRMLNGVLIYRFE